MKSVKLVIMNIRITDLSRKTTEEELTKLFAAYGTVSSTTIVMDKKTGKSKGFGFIEMADDKEALTAVKKIHKVKLDGEKITVKQIVESK
ncbi:MAG: RNA-binding protein [Spirochaetaceae bacterium]